MVAAAVVGSAVVGGVATAASSASAAKSAKKSQANATAANNALARETYERNSTNLAPFMDRGNRAGAQIDALLGTSSLVPVSAVPGTAAAAQVQNALEPSGAFNRFRESTGYNFRVGEGMKALNTGYAARGALESGAAAKAALRYGQGLASDEFGRYLGYLGNQQQVGLSGANALAGVGNTMVNTVSNNNDALAAANANAGFAKSNAVGGAFNGVTNALGFVAGNGGFGSSSYGVPRSPWGIADGGGIY